VGDLPISFLLRKVKTQARCLCYGRPRGGRALDVLAEVHADRLALRCKPIGAAAAAAKALALR